MTSTNEFPRRPAGEESWPDLRTLREAVRLATRAPSVHNTQPWRVRIGATNIQLYADETRWLAATDPQQRDLLVSCGAFLHHLQAALAGCGVEALVRRLPNPQQPQHLASLELGPHRPSDAELRRAGAIMHRRSDRRPFSNMPVPTRSLRDLTAAAREFDVVLQLVEGGRAVTALTEVLDDAARVQEKDTAYGTELALWTGRALSSDGIPAANLLAPAGPEWNGSRQFPAGQIELPTGTAPDGASFMVLGTNLDTRAARIRAGQALSNTLLRATELGLASCVFSQPLEVPFTWRRLRDDVLLGSASPQAVIRVGWSQTRRPLRPTPRRSVDDILEVTHDHDRTRKHHERAPHPVDHGLRDRPAPGPAAPMVRPAQHHQTHSG